MELSVASRNGMTRLLSKFLVLGLFGTVSIGAAHAEEGAAGNDATSESAAKVSKAAGSEETPSTGKKAPVVTGVAQTLPQKVIRAAFISNTVTGSGGYDPNGKKEDLGFDLYLRASAYAVAYGITDRLTFQAGLPVISQEKTSMNANEFRKTKTYRANYLEVTQFVAKQLVEGGACTDLESCQNRIDNENLVIPYNKTFRTPTTGEVVNYNAGTPIKTVADAYVTRAAQPSGGKKGPGDFRFGLGYMAYSDVNQILTFGLGVTIPTGAYDKPAAYRTPGRGFTAYALNTLYDYRILPALVVSWRNESEYLSNSVTRHRASQLDPTQFNSADPTIDNDGDGKVEGDGVPNEYKVKRKGIKNSGGFKISSNLSYVHPLLNPISWGYSYNYSFDPAYKNPNAPSLWGRKGINYKSQMLSQTFNISLDGLNMEPRLPFTLAYAKTVPLSGKALAIATAQDELTVALFYKF